MPLFYSTDDFFTRELIKELIKRKRYVRRASKQHIKHRKLNYFTTGKITVDGEGLHYETGAEAFLKLVELRYANRLGPKINPFEDLAPREEIQPTPIFEVNLDDVHDLGDDHEQDGDEDAPL